MQTINYTMNCMLNRLMSGDSYLVCFYILHTGCPIQANTGCPIQAAISFEIFFNTLILMVNEYLPSRGIIINGTDSNVKRKEKNERDRF